MAFATVHDADTTSGEQASNASTWTLTYPANIVAGNLLLVFVGRDGSGGAGTNSGWVGRNNAEGACTLNVYKRSADGSETGTFTMDVGASEQGCWRVLRISGWEGTLGTNFLNDANSGAVCVEVATGTASLNPDPPSINPNNWGVEDTLWIAASASDHGNTTYTGFPASWTNTSAQESVGAGGAGFGTARLESAAASVDPGTFTTDASEQWAADTIAIRPAAAAVAIPFLVQARRV